MKRTRILGNERGSVLILAAVGIVVACALAVLAIDGSMMMTTKNQLQAAADAAALAGASGLVEGSKDEATARAIAYASFNEATQNTQQPVIITAEDISFPEADVIRVVTHRTVATGDPLRTFFMKIADMGSNNLTDVTAVAAAKWYDVCSASCIKPWVIPDRWNDANGNGAPDPGEYDPVTTGYNAPADVGLNVVLKVGNPSQSVSPGQFYPIDLPSLDCNCGVDPVPGGAEYRNNIANCNQYPVKIGDRMVTETGNMVGPTRQGMQELIDSDPGAYWDAGEGTVKGSAFGVSPRIAIVPFFDPTTPPSSGKNWVRVVKLGAFFLESIGPGSQVNGRFMQLTTQGTGCAGGNGNSFLKGIALVE